MGNGEPMLPRGPSASIDGESDDLSGAAATPLHSIDGKLTRGRGWSASEGPVDGAPSNFVVPDHSSLGALFGAAMCGGPGAAAAGWRRGEDCAQITVRIGLEAVRVRLSAVDAAAAWREVHAISPLALDVLTVLVDRFQVDRAEIRLASCAEILEAKCCRRRGGERRSLEQQVGDELMRLGRLTVRNDDEPLLAVTPVGGGAKFVVSLRPGVKALWDAAPTRRLGRAVIEFDHRTNRGADVLAKKLGVYFGLAGAESRPVLRRVGTVLKAIGAAQELVSGARGGRLADRFEEASLRLQERGLFVIGYRGGGDLLGPDARIKGWVKRWLDAEIIARPLP